MSEWSSFFLVDAFAEYPFSGNPAGVLLYDAILPTAQMQAIANEVNASETAFPVPVDGKSFEESSYFKLRWFTPQVEVPLCGHATLATAHVLFHELGNRNTSLSFDTRSGELTVKHVDDYYAMDFPAGLSASMDVDASVYAALGLNEANILETRYCSNPNKLVVVVDSENIIRNLEPDFLKLREISSIYNAGSIVVTSTSASRDYDFISRNFAPLRGVNEDPVTGSSHVILGPYWQEKLNKSHLTAFQASPRGGVMIVEIGDNDRVVLKGKATTVTRGQMVLPFET